MRHALPAYVPWCARSSSRRVTPLTPVRSQPSVCASRGVGTAASRPKASSSSPEIALTEGPSCIFVGPLETASKDMLEALYLQARDSYYSGKPLIVDDMFDKVELKLRCYGSRSVVKYPRCSLRRHSTYADAEEDVSQLFALASVWILLLALGSLAILVPAVYTLGVFYQEIGYSRLFFHSSRSSQESLSTINGMLFTGLIASIGLPVALASAQVLGRLWRNDLVALKGSCPNCGEEVFAFVNVEIYGRPFRRTDCHVCESALEFQTKVVQSVSRISGRWVYGRVYLVQQRAT